MKALLIGVLAVILSVSVADAQTGADGRVSSISIPSDVEVFEQVTAVVGVSNPTESEKTYTLDLTATKDGSIRASESFEVAVIAGGSSERSFSFVPDDVGEFEFVARLTDRSTGELADVQIVDFNSFSEIGPFEIQVESPSDVVAPSAQAPVKFTVTNRGSGDVDAVVRLVMDCESRSDLERDFEMKLPAESTLERTELFTACDEVGLRDMIASVVVFERSWVTSTRQVYLDDYQNSLSFEAPSAVSAETGRPSVFDVRVTNVGTDPVNNVLFHVTGVPGEWVSVDPVEVERMVPGASSLFIVNITPSRSADEGSLELGFAVTGDQIVVVKNSILRVSPSGLPVETETVVTRPVSTGDSDSFLSDILDFVLSVQFLVGVGAVAVIAAFIMSRKHVRSREVKKIYNILNRPKEEAPAPVEKKPKAATYKFKMTAINKRDDSLKRMRKAIKKNQDE